MFEQAFKNIDDVLWKEAGCTTELDYTTNPLNDDDLAEFVELQPTCADSPKSWSVDAATIDPATFDLSVKNSNGGEEVTHHSPEAIMNEIAALDSESAEVLATIRRLL